MLDGQYEKAWPNIIPFLLACFICISLESISACESCDEWTDKDGKTYTVVGHNAKDSEVMVINGKRYCRATPEFEADIIVDDQPYCLIGSLRRRKSTTECSKISQH